MIAIESKSFYDSPLMFLQNAMNAAEITDKLGLHSLRQRAWVSGECEISWCLGY